MEALAWEWVNATCQINRPSRIFLVTGQTLTDEFDITHKEENHSGCELSLEPNVGVPQLADLDAVFGYRFNKASAFSGFEVSRKPDDGTSRQYSVFLELYESRPIRRIRFEPTFRARLEHTFRYSWTSSCLS